MHLKQFEAYVSWPGVKFYYSGGVDPVNDARPCTAVDKEFNTKLDEFLGRED